MNDLTSMTPEELRELIWRAKARLKEVDVPGKRWCVDLACVRETREIRSIVVQAEDADAALAAAVASSDDLGRESDRWQCVGDEVDGIDAEVDRMETDEEPDYRVGADGKLEAVERPVNT
jgi:hypothetical protein